MNRSKPKTIREQLDHGHSDLVRLLDEVDAHLAGLSAEPETPDVILEEFVHYSHRLRDEIVEHIAEEEGELFPMVKTVASGAELDELSRLQAQHRDLVRTLDTFSNTLDTLPAEPPEALCAGLKTLREIAIGLRAELRAHSRDERKFLRDVGDRLSVACLRA